MIKKFSFLNTRKVTRKNLMIDDEEVKDKS